MERTPTDKRDKRTSSPLSGLLVMGKLFLDVCSFLSIRSSLRPFKWTRTNTPQTAKIKKRSMRRPGIEPGAQAWEAYMLPLHYLRMRSWPRSHEPTVKMDIFCFLIYFLHCDFGCFFIYLFFIYVQDFTTEGTEISEISYLIRHLRSIIIANFHPIFFHF